MNVEWSIWLTILLGRLLKSAFVNGKVELSKETDEAKIRRTLHALSMRGNMQLSGNSNDVLMSLLW